MVWSRRFIIQPCMPLLCPAFEHFIHPRARRLEIRADGRDGPAFRVQIDDGSPSLIPVGDLCVGRIALCRNRWLWSISQHPLDGVVGELAAKTQKANGRDFMEAKARIFGLEIDDQLAYLRWETAPRLRVRRMLFVKQRSHTLLLKQVGLVVQGPFARSGFFRPLCCCLPKKDNGSQPLIDLLFRPERRLLNLLPVVGAGSSLPLARRHDDHLFVVFSW